MYCVFYKNEIIGRFLRKEKALYYMIECLTNRGIQTDLQEMSKEKYKNYMENLIKGGRG